MFGAEGLSRMTLTVSDVLPELEGDKLTWICGVPTTTQDEENKGDYSVSSCVASVRQEGVRKLKEGDQIELYSAEVFPFPTSLSLNGPEAVKLFRDGVKAYTALIYLGHLVRGDTVVILNGDPGFTRLAVQLSLNWGTKVIAVVSDDGEKDNLERKFPHLSLVIDAGDRSHCLSTMVMEETGGLGAELIVDHSGKYAGSVSSHSIVSSLAVGGRWVTVNRKLQVDPPESEMLFDRGASLSFLNEEVWAMSGGQLGRYTHMVTDIVQKFKDGVIG